MKNQILAQLWANKHTSTAAVTIAGLELVSGLVSIWAPHYQAQTDQTVKLIQKLAIMYGFIMAGDAGAQPTTSVTVASPAAVSSAPASTSAAPADLHNKPTIQ